MEWPSVGGNKNVAENSTLNREQQFHSSKQEKQQISSRIKSFNNEASTAFI
jgi:hypothetical protein